MSDQPPPIPMITAAEIFPALEMLAWNARSELCLSFRIFDPKTRLRSQDLLDAGLTDWASLLAKVSAKGVTLRLLMTDFDALFTPDLHRDAWRNAGGFATVLSGDSHVLCAQHAHIVGPFWRLILRHKVAEKMRDLRNIPQADLTPVQRDILENGPVLRPVTLHQKFAVADGAHAILGGLDVDERRWDDPTHDQAPEQTWHDVSVKISGPLCQNIRAHFVDCWAKASDDDTPKMDARSARPVDLPSGPSGAPRLVRTLSTPRRSFTALGPHVDVTEHEEALIAAFQRARHHIYIETQFFRHRPLAQALARAAYDNADLQLVLLMPTEPERIVFGGDDGIDARYAQALQIRNLDILHAAFGDRMAVVSPSQPSRADADEPGTLGGAGIVYVHAKVALIDDCWGMIGSANLNGRSMRWDTEASVVFDDPDTVRNLRERLARIWLSGLKDLGDATQARTWTEAARVNQGRAPEDRSGFVMPYPKARNRRFATFLPILPADMF